MNLLDVCQSSRLVPPADSHNTTGQANPSDHGYGPLEVSLPGFPSEIDSLVVGTSKAPGAEVLYNLDVNSGHPLGLSKLGIPVSRAILTEMDL